MLSSLYSFMAADESEIGNNLIDFSLRPEVESSTLPGYRIPETNEVKMARCS
jgi:hypothetical protein